MFRPEVANDAAQDETNRAENKEAGHTGFHAPVVTIGREFTNQVITQKSQKHKTHYAAKEANADVFHTSRSLQ